MKDFEKDLNSEQAVQLVEAAPQPPNWRIQLKQSVKGLSYEEGAQALRPTTGGSQLPPPVQAKMERSFGSSFDDVRVHQGPEAQALGASAFTKGSDITFAPGQYDPTSQSGQQLLGHELAHVVQQRGGVVSQPQGKGAPINANLALEAEADTAGVRAARGEQVSIRGASSKGIQMKPARFTPDEIFTALGSTRFKVKREPEKKVSPLPTSISGPAKQVGKEDQWKTTSLEEKLGQSTRAQQRDPRTETMRERVQMVMDQFLDNYAEGHTGTTTNAMLIALAIDGVARIIADELYDPAQKSVIAKHLVDLYQGEIRRALPKQKGGDYTLRKKSLDLAKIIVSDDPVSLYMHDEIRKEDAAMRIRQMADAAKRKPLWMFDLLRERFESEMASYSIEDIKSREHQRGSFNLKETPGELSVDYMKKLFPELKAPDAKGKPKRDQDKALKFDDEMAKKLTELREEVMKKKGKGTEQEAETGETGEGTLTPRQKKHLEEVAAKDQTVVASRTQHVMSVLTDKTGGFKLSEGAAQKVVSQLKAGIPKLPLTITVKGYNWFGKDRPVKDFDPAYKAGSSRRREADIGALLGKPGKSKKKLPYLGKYEGDRPDDYLIWRTWKDQRMTGNLGFTDEELPTFGALNVNWGLAHGTEGMPEDLQKAFRERTGRSPSPDTEAYGINYYGDTHFVLKKDKVKDRLVYTASDLGQPHRDPFLAFADFLVGNTEGDKGSTKDYKATIGLKSVQNENFAKEIINAVLEGGIRVREGLRFEVQFFGGIDVTSDIEAVYVSPGIPPIVAQRLMALLDKLKVPIRVAEPPKGVDAKILNRYEITDPFEELMKKTQRSTLTTARRGGSST